MLVIEEILELKIAPKIKNLAWLFLQKVQYYHSIFK